jgi:hypothetical protein
LQAAGAAAWRIDMADRESTYPIPCLAAVPLPMLSAARRWEEIALKWRHLAERRRDQHFDLYTSGRWRNYYTGEEFLAEMRQAASIAERWMMIAALPDERQPGADVEQPKAA